MVQNKIVSYKKQSRTLQDGLGNDYGNLIIPWTKIISWQNLPEHSQYMSRMVQDIFYRVIYGPEQNGVI